MGTNLRAQSSSVGLLGNYVAKQHLLGLTTGYRTSLAKEVWLAYLAHTHSWNFIPLFHYSVIPRFQVSRSKVLKEPAEFSAAVLHVKGLAEMLCCFTWEKPDISLHSNYVYHIINIKTCPATLLLLHIGLLLERDVA